MRPELIVIGGSAGALEPLIEIIGALSDDVIAPIAVVLHVPRQATFVPELLARYTSRRVLEAEDKQPLEPRTTYVAPPDYHILIERSRVISLSVDAPVCFSRPSIDVLFESAADALGAAVVAVVLSGANADGSHGLATVASAGGTAIIQAPATEEHPTMPRSAAELVSTAHLLAPDQVAPFLAQLGGASHVEYVP